MVRRKRPGSRQLGIAALLVFSVAVFLTKPQESTLPATDASTHAALAMSTTGQGLIPHFPIGAETHGGHWGAGFNDHPFLFFYVNGWIMRALGPDAFSAKLLPCLFSIACVLLTTWLGTLYYSGLAGFFSGVILVLSREFVVDGVNGHLDNVMLFFVLGSFILWDKKKYYWAGACAGMGIWFKTPMALLLFPTVVSYALFKHEFKETWKKAAVSLSIALLTGSLVWIFTGVFGGWDLVRDYWVRQLWGTAVGGRGGAQPWDPFLFFKVLRTHYMPWTVFLVTGIGFGIYRKRWLEKAFLVPVTAAALVILVVSAMRFKFDHYFVPAYPFLALIAAQPLADWLDRFEEKIYRGFAVLAIGIATLLLATPIETSPESFPALKRYMALIQSYGSCAQKVLFVEGNQPYGSYVDYKPLINFYTGRQVIRTDCRDASLQALDPDIGWILISGDPNICLDEASRQRFPKVFLYGNQYLYTRLIPKNEVVDLTPLARELKAAVDCQPAPLPHDRYHAYIRSTR